MSSPLQMNTVINANCAAGLGLMDTSPPRARTKIKSKSNAGNQMALVTDLNWIQFSDLMLKGYVPYPITSPLSYPVFL